MGRMTWSMQRSLALECGIGKCMEPHTVLANMAAFTTPSPHGAPQPGPLPRHSRLSCLEQRPPFCFCSVALC